MLRHMSSRWHISMGRGSQDCLGTVVTEAELDT